MATQWQRLARTTQGLITPMLQSVVVVVMVRIGFDRLERWREYAASDFGGHWWQYFLAGLALSSVGFLAGIALLGTAIGRRFDWRRAVGLGVVPFLLAMTLPLSFWGWPLSSANSLLWDFRVHFTADEYIGAAWILLGLAIAGGFGSTRRA